MPGFGFLYPLSEFVAWYFFIDKYSFWDAFLLCVSTGFVGLIIVSMHGRALLGDLTKAQMDLQSGPARGATDLRSVLSATAFNRIAIMAGGLFLFIPGLVAKTMGTLLILPGTRHLMIWFAKAAVAEKFIKTGFQFVMKSQSWGSGFPGASGVARDVSNRDVLDVTPKAVKHTSRDSGSSGDPSSH
jgi:UPF0716 family protein affecting phage T7 exclusion